MPLRIAIVGAGAVGGYVGAYLTAAGEDVALIDPWPEHVALIRSEGLRIEELAPEQGFTQRLRALHLSEAQGLVREAPVDIAFIAVKSYDTAWATALIKPYLAPDGIVVALQNGINEETIAEVVGWPRTLGCVPARIAVELYAPGRIRRSVPRGGTDLTVFRVGELHGRVTPRLQALAALIGKVDTVKLTTNLWGERWSKLCVNGMRNGLAAATGLAGNDIDRIEAVRRFGIRLGGEAVRIGQALGYQLEEIYNLEAEPLARAHEGDPAALAAVEAILLAATRSNSRSDLQRPSMGQDIVKGRRTEIDEINGLIAARGREIGLPVAAHEALAEIVRRIQRGELAPSPTLLPTL
ncbi:ketopantoate reductase family protein [Roseomonas sp. 18066]|uniref:ketopantoate reductase family protein n=1 Tax=Roseomonas sp. 18066 TaxID=2681412 RepID=UPI00135BA409|nr:2-dehydropantoate 2-reductase [Roseomonas sp. 18066]